MKSKFGTSTTKRGGFTLLELTIVMLVLLSLIGMGVYGTRGMNDWKLGRTASETLRDVYTAQRLYLSDNPTTEVDKITSAALLPYMPGSPAIMPTVRSLAGTNLSILVDRSPPRVNNGAEAVYDPSGSSTDSLWDVGE